MIVQPNRSKEEQTATKSSRGLRRHVSTSGHTDYVAYRHALDKGGRRCRGSNRGRTDCAPRWAPVWPLTYPGATAELTATIASAGPICVRHAATGAARASPLHERRLHRLSFNGRPQIACEAPCQALALIVDLDNLLSAVVAATHAATFAARCDGMRGAVNVGCGRRLRRMPLCLTS